MNISIVIPARNDHENLRKCIDHIKTSYGILLSKFDGNFPVVIGANDVTMQICEALLDNGIYTQGIRHPSVPEGSARLRLTPMATHREEEIDALAGAVAEEVSRSR